MTELRIAYSGNPFGGIDQLVDSAVRAERAGFDVFAVPHLPGALSPLVVLTAAARATTTIRLSPFVINSGLYQPIELARELASLDQISGGRLEVALGSGIPHQAYSGVMPPTRDARFERLRDMASTILDSADEPAIAPGFVEKPRLLIAGTALRVLRLAADLADGFIVAAVPPVPKVTLPRGHLVLSDREATTARVAQFRELAGARADQLEIGVGLPVVLTDDVEAAVAELAAIHTYFTAEQILSSPKIVIGSAEQIGEQIAERARNVGITYSVLRGQDPDALAPAVSVAKAG